MILSEILRGIECSGSFLPDAEINDIAYDSRKTGTGIMFVCLTGAKSDGHAFAPDAYENGSRVFVAEHDISVPADAIVIKLKNSREALPVMCANFFGHPSEKLKVIGITGTKGKTTTTHLIKAILDANGVKTGIIGTVGAAWGDKTAKTGYTTPEAYELQKLLSQMLSDGCEAVAMEVSSLGLKAHRTDCIDFDTAVFLNISTDHIGGTEHESYEEYYAWKKVLFSHCRRAVGCADDNATADMLEKAPEKTLFGFSPASDYRATDIRPFRDGSCLGVSFECTHGGKSFKNMTVGLPGDYSVHNALAAIAVCSGMGIKPENQREALRTARVRGRTEPVEVNDDYAIFIDYAHNGTSLENLLKTMRAYNPERLICLFGSVGGRAQVRRAEMGTAAGMLSDLAIVTSDDPDFEDPKAIADEVSQYVARAGGRYLTIPDRAKAIETAVGLLKKGDLLMLCGKGHEDYQKINGVKLPFSERECVEQALKASVKK
ncbi:MAG: UDP-N-acetylmuramoyl-L-alanyl-D-glutamate--2,6-diaminopimelate ligase [Clostridiales bacterium]|nr:UDP-N-acetylmuramoyl-L-alanyl-D-glutamate--2,6-diaminopimelate ligase [Clostridiales bacterium]